SPKFAPLVMLLRNRKCCLRQASLREQSNAIKRFDIKPTGLISSRYLVDGVFERRRDVGQPAAKLIRFWPAKTDPHITAFLFEPMTGADKRLRFAIQDLVKTFHLDARSILDPREANYAAHGLDPFEMRLDGHPLFDDPEMFGDFAANFGQPLLFLPQESKCYFLIYHGVADHHLFFGCQKRLHQLLVTAGKPPDPDAGQSVGF